MVKKNNPNTARAWVFKNFFALAAVAVAFANVWFLYRIAPVIEDIRVLQTKVMAIEKQQDKTDNALIRINQKLDTIMMRVGR